MSASLKQTHASRFKKIVEDQTSLDLQTFRELFSYTSYDRPVIVDLFIDD